MGWLEDLPRNRGETREARWCPVWSLAVVGFVVVALAAFGHAISGFGFALVAVPLLAVLVGPEQAVVAVVAVSLVLYGGAWVRTRGEVEPGLVSRLVVPALVGMPVGVLLLRVVGDRLLLALIAVVTLALTLWLWRWRRGGGRTRQGRLLPASLASGVLLTATGMNGPPLVLACQSLGLAPARFRATLQATFGLQQLAAIGLLGVTGKVSAEVVWVVGGGLPALVLGWWAGNRVFSRLDAHGHGRVVLLGMLASGLVALGRALMGP